MRTSPKLQQFIQQLAAKHGLAVEQPGAYLRLDLADADHHLVVENLGIYQVSVALYWEENGQRTPDPEVIFYLTPDPKVNAGQPTTLVWIPMERCQRFGGWQLHLELDAQGNIVESFDRPGQFALAEFSETVFVADLIRQGWMAGGQKSALPRPLQTQEELQARPPPDRRSNP